MHGVRAIVSRLASRTCSRNSEAFAASRIKEERAYAMGHSDDIKNKFVGPALAGGDFNCCLEVLRRCPEGCGGH